MTRESFKTLFDNHFDSVRNYIYYRSGDKELATDIAQETFLKVWEKQMKIDDSGSSALLYKMAGNLFISHYRRNKLDLNFKLNYKHNFSNQTPQDVLQYEELKTKYDIALAKMPEKQRIVFMMSRMDKLKYHEIADKLGLSTKAIEKRMKLALAYLRKKLDY